MTIADISIFSTVCAIDLVFKIERGKLKWPKLFAWYTEMCKRPSYKTSMLPGLQEVRDILQNIVKFQIE